jgi:ABC-type cobalamin/Fe3+-siderophores transport system ATPase subunit
MAELSSGQRQDLAVAVFLARALSLGGTFLLDEPLLHLDELNRVAIIDTLRTIALQQGDRMRVVLTTANEMLVDMFVEKFRMVQTRDGWPGLQVIELHGNCRSPSGVQGRAQA